VYLLGTFLTVGALIGGTRSLWVGLGLATLTTAVIAVFPLVLSVLSSIPQEQFLRIQEELLSKILTACFEGVFYIVLAAIAVLIIGIMVRLFVRNLGNFKGTVRFVLLDPNGWRVAQTRQEGVCLCSPNVILDYARANWLNRILRDSRRTSSAV